MPQAFVDLVVNGGNTTFVSINHDVGELAARLRAQYNLRLPDALQIGAAIMSGCDGFLTNDTQLARVAEMDTIVIDELEPDEILATPTP